MQVHVGGALLSLRSSCGTCWLGRCDRVRAILAMRVEATPTPWWWQPPFPLT